MPNRDLTGGVLTQDRDLTEEALTQDRDLTEGGLMQDQVLTEGALTQDRDLTEDRGLMAGRVGKTVCTVEKSGIYPAFFMASGRMPFSVREE